MKQTLQIKQIQTTSQRVIQTNMILGLTTHDLEKHILEEAETNPLIEIVDDPAFSGYAHHKELTDEEYDEFWMDSGESETLKDHLNAQIIVRLSKKEEAVLNYLLESLDQNGYLRVKEEETAGLFSVSVHTVRKLIQLIQSLEPAGVGAADLKECLILQLQRDGIKDEKLYRFIREGLELLAGNKHRQLLKRIGITADELTEYVDIIQSLDPRPGSAFTPVQRNIAIIPDIYIDQTDTGFQIQFNDHIYHQIRITEHYKAMYRQAAEKEKTFLKKNMQKASLLQRAIDQRKNMIVSLAEYILDRQKAFFTEGEGHLEPLRMIEAAEALSVNVSSISRAVSGKYLKCTWGIYPLKYFFAHNIRENQPVSTDIKTLIRELIREEDKENPLSDSAIAAKLAERNIEISRRTVAKYRSSEGIQEMKKRKLLR